MSIGIETVRIIADFLTASGVENVYAHDAGISDVALPRTVIVLDNVERQAGLPGIYEVSGRIERTASPDDEDAQERAIGEDMLYQIAADIDAMQGALSAYLTTYIYRFEGDTIIEIDPHYTYQLNWSARVATATN